MAQNNEAVDESLPGGIGTTPVAIAPFNINRHYLIIQNNSNVNIAISLSGETPGFDSNGNGLPGSLVLPPLGVYIVDSFPCPTNGITAVASAGAGNALTCIEW